jgi:hypothetical protein
VKTIGYCGGGGDYDDDDWDRHPNKLAPSMPFSSNNRKKLFYSHKLQNHLQESNCQTKNVSEGEKEEEECSRKKCRADNDDDDDGLVPLTCVTHSAIQFINCISSLGLQHHLHRFMTT